MTIAHMYISHLYKNLYNKIAKQRYVNQSVN